MFGLRRRKRKKLYVLETPYSKLFNLDAEGLAQHRALMRAYPPTYPETIREMTEDEIRKYAN